MSNQPSNPDPSSPFNDPSRVWGYTVKDLKRHGMESVIPPGHNKKQKKSPNPKKELPPPMETSIEIIDPVPQSPEPVQRKRGAQPGNLNALKHGLYLEGARIRNTTPLERAELFDIYNIINYIKDFMEHTYQSGLLTKDLNEINETMRSLSLAGMSLTRLIAMHDQHISSPLPGNIQVDEKTSILKIVEHYKKKLAPIVDLSDIDTTYFEDK